MRARDRTAEEIALEYQQDISHPVQVARLAAQLFDACASLHQFGPAEKRLLEQASILHDIGWVDGQAKHHKRSYGMILATPPHGLTARETAIVASVARYHRRAIPKLSHAGFAALSKADREIVTRLAALIRIADGLDYTHRSICSIRGCAVGADRVVVELDCTGECSTEIAKAAKKADLFEEVSGRKVSFAVGRMQ